MNLKLSENKRVERQYKISKLPQRRNPVYKQKLENPIVCKFCDETIKDTTGRKKKWRSLNELHGHCSYEHIDQDFRNWLIGLATQIIKGDLS